MIRRQQRRSDHHMVLRPVHMAARQRHHPLDNGDRIARGLPQAQLHEAVKPLHMAVATHVVPVYAARLGELFFAADLALHLHIRLQIFQRRAADQAFLFHSRFSSPVSGCVRA